ncbi:hypothetical protein IWZ01DRAFT_162993 [Phyllosticta capitalensis]
MDGNHYSHSSEWDILSDHYQIWENSPVRLSNDHDDCLLGIGGGEDCPMPPDPMSAFYQTDTDFDFDFNFDLMGQEPNGASSLGSAAATCCGSFLPINGNEDFMYNRHHDPEPFSHVAVLQGNRHGGLVDENMSDQHPGGIPIPQSPGTASNPYSLPTEPSLLYGSSYNSSHISANSFDYRYLTSLRERHQSRIPSPSPLHQMSLASSASQGCHAELPNSHADDVGHKPSPQTDVLDDFTTPVNFVHCFQPGDAARPDTVKPDVEPPKRTRGRKGPLNYEQRKSAALLRKIGACQNCRRRKFKCDAGIPCQSCLKYYGSDLVHSPCRDWHLNDISSSLLSDIRSWHPRPLESFLEVYPLDPTIYELNIRLGHGPPVPVQVCMMDANPVRPIFHEHLVYPWPPRGDQAPPQTHTHSVFQAFSIDQDRLHRTLNRYLSYLVDDPAYIHSFPLFRSRLQVFEHVYHFYRSLDTHSLHWKLLHRALKLLILVHVGDITELDPSINFNPSFSRFINANIACGLSDTSTPCFIRGQLGAAVPALASYLLSQTLTLLYEASLPQKHRAFPAVVATMAIILMARESVQYHAARLAYHARHDAPQEQPVFGPERPPAMMAAAAAERKPQDPSPDPVDKLLAFYRACYGEAHALYFPLIPARSSSPNFPLAPPPSPSSSSSSPLAHSYRPSPPPFADAPAQTFVDALRGALAGDETARYVSGRVGIGVSAQRNSGGGGQGMAAFFDRLLGRLFVGVGG